ncbi:MAG: hypothetical protein ACREQ5_12275 [Candidatus Dormibacteria bacterium]
MTHRDAAWVMRMGRHGVQVLAVVLVLALVFTMVNVQQFAAQGQPVGGVQWFIAWLLDPMASITMAAAIVFEGLLADHGRPKEPWLNATKWYAGVATWTMNIWSSAAAGSLAGVVLHSVAPGILLGLAEAAPRVRRSMAVVIADLERGAKAITVHDEAPAQVPVPVPVATWEPIVPGQTWVAPTGPPSWAAVTVESPAEPVVPAVPEEPTLEPEPAREPELMVDLVEPVAVAEKPVPALPAPDPVLVQVIAWPAVDPPAAAPVSDDELDVIVRQIRDDATAADQKPPGRRAIAGVLGDRATPDRVRRSLQRVSEPARVLSLNGAGSGAGEQRAGGQGGGQ